MKALILAAGIGSRLHHKTSDIPKALVPVSGNPILWYQLSALLSQNIDNVGVVIGKHGNKIIHYIKHTFPNIVVKYIWNHEFSTSNSSYSFWLAKDFVSGEPYLHLNCDIIFSPSILSKIITSKHNNIIAIRKDVSLDGHMEHVELNGSRITHMSIKRTLASVGKAFGLAKFSAQHVDESAFLIEGYLYKKDKNQHYYGMIRELVNTIDYHALDAKNDLLLEVNTLDDHRIAKNILSTFNYRKKSKYEFRKLSA